VPDGVTSSTEDDRGVPVGAALRTFLIADVRGYTRFTQEHGDEEAGRLAARFAELAREAVLASGGEVIELRGDEALCVFDSARQALRGAVGLQATFRRRSEDGGPAFPLAIGVGLDAGEAVPIEGGYRGGALNTAARLCSLAAGGEILATETVVNLARRTDGMRFVERRPVKLKGLERPVRVIEVVPEPALPPVPDAPAPKRRWLTPVRLVLAGAIVVAAAVGAAAFQVTRDHGGGAVPGSGVDQLDPATGELLAAVPLGSAPSTVAVGEGAAWVIDANDRTVSRIDVAEPGDPRTFSTASTPTAVAVGVGGVWVGNGDTSRGDIFTESVSRLDPESAITVETIELPRGRTRPSGYEFSRRQIAVTGSAVWAINPDLSVSRIDPRTNRLVARVAGMRAANIAAGSEGVWIVEEGGIAEIDPRTNAVARRIDVPAESLAALAVGAGAVWIADPEGGSVWRVDPAARPDDVVLRQIPLDRWVGEVAFGEGAVWATNEIADKVYRIDPRTNEPEVFTGLTAPRGVAVGEGSTWITAADPPSDDAELPESLCGGIVSGAVTAPRFLIVSDLPLQGSARTATSPMVEGIRFALEQRGFKAGSHTLGFQSCDSSTAQAGRSDEYRCALNAKAFARNLDVMAVFGSYNSYCSSFQIPVANVAPDGPLAMLSPSNTYTGLTRPFDGHDPDELASLYPSGERSFVRIAAANHLLAAAQVQLAKDLGADSVFLLGDIDGMAADARTAAGNLGLRIAGSTGWSFDARTYGALARSVSRTRPGAVAVFGFFERNEDALFRELRAALGPEVPVIAMDGFLVSEFVEAVGPAAQGMYFGVYGLPNDELPPEGKRFLRAFEAAHGGEPTSDYSATYGAQAAEIVLDAIARSDGTRASVNRELRRTSVEDGILGDIRFDRNGDLLRGPITIVRVAGKGPGFVPGMPGTVFDRVVDVRSALLR
jgi:branched-chain amino acid transport system substrate-binding protein